MPEDIAGHKTSVFCYASGTWVERSLYAGASFNACAAITLFVTQVTQVVIRRVGNDNWYWKVSQGVVILGTVNQCAVTFDVIVEREFASKTPPGGTTQGGKATVTQGTDANPDDDEVAEMESDPNNAVTGV